MIKYYHFGKVWGMPDASPFCAKLETYLRMAGLEFQDFSGQKYLRTSPKGKLPYIEDDGVKIGDSTLIIQHLKQKYGDPLDQNLTPAQKGRAVMIQRTLEDHLYWALVHNRWLDPNNSHLTRDTFFRGIPGPMRGLIFGFLCKGLHKTLHAQGLGRHTREELYQLAVEDVAAVASLLEESPYLLGDQAASIDAAGYAFLSAFLTPPAQSPMKDYLSGRPEVKAYLDRMNAAYYPS